jgi:hypothetical protein
MAEVFRTGGIRIVVFSNDHPPPHVHALGPDRTARFKLTGPDGPVEFWDCEGRWTQSQLNELGEEIAARFEDCRTAWSKIHG